MEDDKELFILSHIFLQIPWEYDGMGNIIGKKYDAIKDYLKWNGFKPKEYTNIVLRMGQIWVNNIPKKEK